MPPLFFNNNLLAGGGAAGSTHAIKATARPAVSVTTMGLGNPIVSVIEDIISFFMSVFVILLPFLTLIFAMSIVTIVAWIAIGSRDLYAYANKLIEVVLLVLLWLESRQQS